MHIVCVVRACRALERVALDGSMEKLARFTLSECPRLECTAFLANEISRLPPPRVCNRLLVLKPALSEILRVCVAARNSHTNRYSFTSTCTGVGIQYTRTGTLILIRDAKTNSRQVLPTDPRQVLSWFGFAISMP